MKVSLTNRTIPRNKQGDPNFLFGQGVRLYDVFSPQEVCELVNRCIYQLEYQSRAHQKRREEQNSLEKPVKEMFWKLFPHQAWSKATDEQIQVCLVELGKQR